MVARRRCASKIIVSAHWGTDHSSAEISSGSKGTCPPSCGPSMLVPLRLDREQLGSRRRVWTSHGQCGSLRCSNPMRRAQRTGSLVSSSYTEPDEE